MPHFPFILAIHFMINTHVDHTPSFSLFLTFELTFSYCIKMLMEHNKCLLIYVRHVFE